MGQVAGQGKEEGHRLLLQRPSSASTFRVLTLSRQGRRGNPEERVEQQSDDSLASGRERQRNLPDAKTPIARTLHTAVNDKASARDVRARAHRTYRLPAVDAVSGDPGALAVPGKRPPS